MEVSDEYLLQILQLFFDFTVKAWLGFVERIKIFAVVNIAAEGRSQLLFPLVT